MIQYIVQPSDTLYFISLRFKTTVATLMEVNHIPSPDMVFPGQLLNIPLPFSSAGDTSRFPELRRGGTGPFVLLLQSRLSLLGFYKGEMDGVYTPTTEGSVAQFQMSRSLPSTGFVDIRTWRHLLDDSQGTLDSPSYHVEMVLSGLFMLLSADKPVYHPGETIHMSIFKTNLSNKTITLNYNTSQRYDFKLSYPSGRSLWRWSDDKSFTQVLGTLSLSPGQFVRYEARFTLPLNLHVGLLHVFGWNTAKQINHIKLHLTIGTV